MVSIIILSYNTKDKIISCLTSLKKTLKEKSYEIIVVDNASLDDSVTSIKKTFPHITIVENRENIGFARGVNMGAKKARGDTLWILNSDTHIKDDPLPRVETAFSADEKLAIIGTKLVDNEGHTEISYGKFYSLVRIARMLFLPGANLSFDTKKDDVDWVSGGCMFIRRSAFEKVHGFDEDIFMYVEDVEFCYRIKKSGYTVRYLSDTQVMHEQQGSSNRSFAIQHIYKGIAYFYKKHKNTLQYILVKGLLYIKAIGAIGIGVMTGSTYLKSTYSQAIRNL